MRNTTNNASLQTASTPSLEDLAIRSGISSEHVLLESEVTLESIDERTPTVRERFGLRNRIRGTETKFVLFDDGHLSVREVRRGKLRRECTVDLRYLDPRPVVSRRVAKTALRIASSLIGFGLLVGLLVYFAVLPAVAVPVALGSIAAASAASWVSVRRTEEWVAFRTRHGRAIVLTLVANLGCFRACRALARKLAAVIDEARRLNEQDKQRLLRAEMREHYRLSETGVLSVEACTAAIRRTLAHFE